MPILIRGDRLLSATRAEVLDAFGYRWTVENEERARRWAAMPARHTAPTLTDAEWLRTHAFYVNRNGALTTRRGAQSAISAPDPECACCGVRLRPQDSARPVPGTATFKCDLCAQGWGTCCKAVPRG
jgi:hypothetical protein